MSLYRTFFKLTNCVKDIDDAQKYLSEDNMKQYLQYDSRCPEDTFEKIVYINWILTDEDSGYIELKTTQELSDIELTNLSEWVSGQNSDGLGEGFSQQSFACYEDDSSYSDDDDYYEDNFIVAEFDWKTNDYKFDLIED